MHDEATTAPVAEELPIEDAPAQKVVPLHPVNVVPMVGASEFRAVSRSEAAALLSISVKGMERLILRGQLPAFKVLGQWRILLSDLHTFIRQQREKMIIKKVEERA
jgi:excisionase family DNA binding protein